MYSTKTKISTPNIAMVARMCKNERGDVEYAFPVLLANPVPEAASDAESVAVQMSKILPVPIATSEMVSYRLQFEVQYQERLLTKQFLVLLVFHLSYIAKMQSLLQKSQHY